MADATFLAIVNPAAGGGRCGKQFPAALDRLRKAGLEVDVERTQGPGEATEIARRAYRDGRRHFIAVGGDGTSYEIVNGLFPEAEVRADADGQRPSLGFLPMGTGNSFLRDFSDRGAEYAIESLCQSRRRSCDVVRLEHAAGTSYYINLMCIGFVADVNGARARRFKRWGEAGYVAAVLTELAGLRSNSYPHRCDDAPLDRSPIVFASFSNSRFTGGKMMMAPAADTSDGLVDFIRVGPLGRFDLLRTFPKIFSGTHVGNPAVTTKKIRSVAFELDREIDVMLDGEALKMVPKRLDVLPGVLDVHA